MVRAPDLSALRLAAALAVLAVLAGCSSSSDPTEIPKPRVGTAASATHELRQLRTGGRDPRVPPYSRSAFGDSWVDTDGNGCNQRDDVLLRDAVPDTVTLGVQGSCDHDVLAGTWIDPYTGATLVLNDLKDPRQAEGVQIDHIVPLAEAWRSGAARWSEARRRAFANDLAELVAVDGPTNASKGDGDPASWRPRKGYQCTYAERWIEVKSRWHLSVDASERRALGEMLDYC
jgi:hypothetical protein